MYSIPKGMGQSPPLVLGLGETTCCAHSLLGEVISSMKENIQEAKDP